MRIALIALFIALTVRWAFVEPFQIPSGSMEPTLQDGDRILVNKMAYGPRLPFTSIRLWQTSEPERGEMVVFRNVEPDSPYRILVKRVVGLPGEEVRIADGGIYVDGERLTEPEAIASTNYTVPPGDAPTELRYGVRPDDEYRVVPEDHYFLLGDNSGNSRDSRAFGWIPQGHLLGRVFSIWWPLDRWQDFTGFSRSPWVWGMGLVLVAAFTVPWLFGRVYAVDEHSECQSLSRGEHIFVDHLAFGVPIPFLERKLTAGRMPERGELVVYRNPRPGRDRPKLLLGRVAGYSGERVALREGHLEINGARYHEELPFARRSLAEGPGDKVFRVSPEKAADGQRRYFILHDGSHDGIDSRKVGWISHRRLIGPVKAVWWPWTRRRIVTS